MNEILHFHKFQELINELGKICFQLKKMESTQTGNYMYRKSIATKNSIIVKKWV